MSEIVVMDCEEREPFWRTLRSDCKIRYAETAEEGLRMLSEDVGLVFLNMRLPDMNGMEVFRLIKKEYPSAAVIIITSDASDETHAGGPWEQTERKSLRAEEVLRKIEMLLHSSEGAEAGGPVLRELRAGEEDYTDIPPHVVNGIGKVRDFVTQNTSKSLTLAEACRMAGTSKTYFCTFFRQITGHSLRNYHHMVKIRKAEDLLKDRSLSVADVAHTLGYRDPNYFSTIYKRMTGASPRQQQAGLRVPRRKKEAERP